MLLAHYGIEVDEAALREQCGTRDTGTYAGDILKCARSYGLAAEIIYPSVSELCSLLDADVYPIAYIHLFPTSTTPYIHTVIIEAYEEGLLLILDPLPEPREVRLGSFLDNWEWTGRMAVTVQKVNV